MAKKLTGLADPISFPITPATKGLNTGVNARAIDMRESPDLNNTRSYKGQVTTRTGFKGKYTGGLESLLTIDYVWATDGTQTLFTLSGRKAYQAVGSQIIRIPLYTGAGTGTFMEGTTPLDSFSMDPTTLWWSIVTGKTRIQGFDINFGTIWPNSSDFGDLRVICNDTDGVIVIADTANGVEGERLTARSGTAPVSGRAVAFFGGRLVIGAPKGTGGFPLSAYIQWSAVGRADLWASADGGGSQLIGDESDGIQAFSRIGEYLIIFKERSIYIASLTLDPANPFYIVPAPNQAIGMAAPNTVGELGEEQIFLGWDNVYRFGLSGLTPIGDKVKRDLLYGTDGIVPSYINQCVGVIAEEYDEYWLFVPSGKSPAYKSGAAIPNWCPNPTMALAEISGSTTLGSNQINNVSAVDILKVRPGDAISGAAIPVGTLITGASGSTITINNLATDTTAKNKLLINPNGPPNNLWTMITDGASAFTYSSGGVFGTYYNSITLLPTIVGVPTTGGVTKLISRMFGRRAFPFRIGITPPTVEVPAIGNSTGSFVTMRSGTITFVGSILGHNLALLVWLRANAPCTVKLTINQEQGIQLYTRTLTLTASTQFKPFTFDTLISAGGGENHFTIDIECDTMFAKLDIDSVMLTDLGSPTGDSVDPLFIDQSTGFKALAMKGLSGVPEMIPFVIDQIGQNLCDTVWVYNYTDESWWRWRLPVGGFGFDTLKATVRVADLVGAVSDQTWRFDEKLLVALAPTNLISPSDGQIYELSKTQDKDWAGLLDRPILNYWQSKDFDMGRPDLDKTLSRVTIHHDASHPPTVVTVSASTDSGATWVDQIVTIRQGFTDTFADFFVTGSQVRFKVTASGGLFIDGFSVKVVARGEINAY